MKIVIRSGAIFFHDHGVYDRALAALDERRGFRIDGAVTEARHAFLPALRVWAEVLSRPEPDLVICGMGMRDVFFDQGFPTPLRIHRGEVSLPAIPGGRVFKLNDQSSGGVRLPNGGWRLGHYRRVDR